jgi:serine/threonine protein kinase
MGLADGGQILLTQSAFNDARQFVSHLESGDGAAATPLKWIAHGRYLFSGIEDPVEVFEVGVEGHSPLRVPAGSDKARRVVPHDEEPTLGWRPAVGLEVPGRAGWILDHKLGEGGFGEVWLGEHARTRQRRVFKFCFDVQRLRSFKRELTLFRLLRDALGSRDDIATLYEVKLDEPPFFLESEYTDGGDLAEWAERRGGIGAVTVEHRLEIVAQVADAVAAAHSVGVLHKDIKPTNVLIHTSRDGQVQPRLADFGIGFIADRSQLAARHITETGFTVITEMNDSSRTGTRLYAPPEVLSGQPFSIRGDIYALGVMLYQMAIGDLRRPLAEGWQRDVPDEILRGDIVSCTEGDPQRRLESAAELARRLRALPERRQELADRRAAEARVVRRKQFRQRAAIASVVIVLAAASVVAYRRGAAARRVNALTRQFVEQLAATDWSPDSIARLESLSAELGHDSSADGHAARQQMTKAMAERLNRLIHRPGLSAQDQKKIESELAVLASRDSASAGELREALRARVAAMEAVLVVNATEKSGSTTRPAYVALSPGEATFAITGVERRAPGTAMAMGVTCGANTRAELALPATWETLAAPMGFAFVPLPAGELEKPAVVNDLALDGYAFVLDVQYLDSTGQIPPMESRTVAAARAAGGRLTLTVRRRAQALRSTSWDLKQIPTGPLTLSTWRDGSRVGAQINDLPPLEAFDSFPPSLATMGVALKVSPTQRLNRLAVYRRPLPATPHPLEAGDASFVGGDYAAALATYESVAASDPDVAVRREARFKQGVTLARLHRDDEATATLQSVMNESGQRWPAAAGCHLWRLYLESGRRADAQAVFEQLSTRFAVSELNDLVPDDMRRTLLGIYVNPFSGLSLLRRPDKQDIERLKQVVETSGLVERQAAGFYLTRAYESVEDYDAALAVAQRTLDSDMDLFSWYPARLLEAYSTLMRMRGRSREALDRVHRVLLTESGATRPQFWGLLIERARLLVAMGRADQAERDLELFLQHRQDRRNYNDPASASLIMGFLRAERGDAAGARQAWRAGTLRALSVGGTMQEMGTMEVVAAITIGCLGDDVSDEELQDLGNRLIKAGMNNETFELLQRSSFRVSPAVMRAALRDARGRAWARRFALKSDPPPQLIRDFLGQLLGEYLAAGAFDAKRTAEQSRYALLAGRLMARMYENRQIGSPQFLQFVLAWKGSAGEMGWAGLYRALDAPTRGPLGYVMAGRYARLGQADASAAMVNAAERDVDAAARELTALEQSFASSTTAPTSAPIAEASLVIPTITPPGGGKLDAATLAWRAKAQQLEAQQRAAATTPSGAAAGQPVVKLDFVLPMISQKKYRDAEAKLVELYMATPREQSAQTRAIAAGLERVYAAWGMTDKAAVFREPSAAGTQPADEGGRLDVINKLAYTWRVQGKMEQARGLREKVVARAAAQMPAGDPRLVQLRVDFTDLLIAVSDYDAASNQLAIAEKALADAPEHPLAKTVQRAVVRVRDLRARAATQPATTRASTTAPAAGK